MKKYYSIFGIFFFGLLLIIAACEDDDENDETVLFPRHDKAIELNIPVSGSIQNPAFSPGGEAFVFTRFRNGYNQEPADGEWIVFESRPVDVEDQGVIMKYKLDHSSSYEALTEANDDCRQPNLSPSGSYILLQRFENEQWNIWIMKPDGTVKEMITSGEGDKTDASFTNDGRFIVYSFDSDLEFANIYKISIDGGNPVRLTNYDGYDGAPSISPDGSTLAFESYPGDPDDSEGTKIFILEPSD